MLREADVSEIVRRAGAMFADAEREGVYLRLTGRLFSDGWLYLVAELSRPGGRASDHARFMTRVERQLRQDGYDQVLLVPSIPEHAGLLDVPTPAEVAAGK